VLAVVRPMTNTGRDFPFHVPVPGDSSPTGFIMLEGVKSIDFRVRRARRSRHTSDKLLSNVLSILDASPFADIDGMIPLAINYYNN